MELAELAETLAELLVLLSEVLVLSLPLPLALLELLETAELLVLLDVELL